MDSEARRPPAFNGYRGLRCTVLTHEPFTELTVQFYVACPAPEHNEGWDDASCVLTTNGLIRSDHRRSGPFPSFRRPTSITSIANRPRTRIPSGPCCLPDTSALTAPFADQVPRANKIWAEGQARDLGIAMSASWAPWSGSTIPIDEGSDRG